MLDIPYIDLSKKFEDEKCELVEIFRRVGASGSYIRGVEGESLEKEIANYLGVKSVLAVNSGTDALICALHAAGCGRGTEVITVSHTFIATVAAIVHVGAKPIFVDIGDDYLIDPERIEEKVTEKTSAILAVHLTGNVCNLSKIQEIANKHGLSVIEDSAQAFGSEYQGEKIGASGNINAFSCHPLKNLGAMGDAGFVVGNDVEKIEKLRRYVNHGQRSKGDYDAFGTVSRMDELQAAILRYRLTKVDAIVVKRNLHASMYRNKLNQLREFVKLPNSPQGGLHSYHTFTISAIRRDELRNHLQLSGVGTAIHYQKAVHMQDAISMRFSSNIVELPRTEQTVKSIISLPIHEYMTEDEIDYVCGRIIDFYS